MTSDSPHVPATRRTELAAFLRTQRARLTPADVGLVTGSASGRRRTKGLTALTEASPQFRDWWAGYPVRYFRPAMIGIKDPRAGLIWLQMFQLRLVDQPDLIAVIQVPADETSLRRVRSLL